MIGPPVVLLSINRTHSISSAARKPPHVLCLHRFLKHSSSIGCPSSTIYDVVAFLSVIISGGEEKLVSVTKIKQRWRTSANNKLIGDGEALCQLFARSRLIVLERVRRSSKANFLHAIAQCCSIRIDIFDDTDVCLTLHDAIKRIEHDTTLQLLRAKLFSSITTFYQCQQCGDSSAPLSSRHEGVCLYESMLDDALTLAVPFLTEKTSLKSNCASCNKKSEHLILSTFTQVHDRFPDFLMYHLVRPTLAELSKLRVHLLDNDKSVSHVYEAASVLLVDEYMDNIVVIKLSELDWPVIYCTNPYESPSTLSSEQINDLYTTSRDVVVFFKHVSEAFLILTLEIVL